MLVDSSDNWIIVKNKEELRDRILLLYPSITFDEDVLNYIATFQHIENSRQRRRSANFPFYSGQEAAGIGRNDRYLIYDKSVICLLVEIACFGIGAWALLYEHDLVGSVGIIPSVKNFVNANPKWYAAISNNSRCVFLYIWRTCRKVSFSRQEIEDAYRETACWNIVSDWDCHPRRENVCCVSQSEEFKSFVYDALTSLKESGILRFSENRYRLNMGYYADNKAK